MLTAPRSILITGASSGIGRALALDYAGPGVFLALSGRDRGRLGEVAKACRDKGAEVAEGVLDVSDRAAMAAWVGEMDDTHPLDLLIANAGISGGTAGGEETEEQTRAIFAVNIDGTLNTVAPAIPRLRARGQGQIAIMSSLAGFRGLPSAPAYSASKAAVRSWGEGLRGWLAKDGITVSVICPGFVESRITEANRFPMPMLMEAERASAIIRRGLARGRGRIAFPWPLYAAVWLFTILPGTVVDALARRLPRKG